jgi:hypothetical protein
MYFTFLTQCPTMLKNLAWTLPSYQNLHESYHPKKTGESELTYFVCRAN